MIFNIRNTIARVHGVYIDWDFDFLHHIHRELVRVPVKIHVFHVNKKLLPVGVCSLIAGGCSRRPKHKLKQGLEKKEKNITITLFFIK